MSKVSEILQLLPMFMVEDCAEIVIVDGLNFFS